MEYIVRYELPILSSTLEKDPIIESENMDKKIEIIGVDEENKLRKVIIGFKCVLCSKHTSARFTPKLHGSYDRIVELVDSEWLLKLKTVNQEDFNYWHPKHYILYLDGVGMFQFIAQGYEVIEDEEIRKIE